MNSAWVRHGSNGAVIGLGALRGTSAHYIIIILALRPQRNEY